MELTYHAAPGRRAPLGRAVESNYGVRSRRRGADGRQSEQAANGSALVPFVPGERARGWPDDRMAGEVGDGNQIDFGHALVGLVKAQPDDEILLGKLSQQHFPAWIAAFKAASSAKDTRRDVVHAVRPKAKALEPGPGDRRTAF